MPGRKTLSTGTGSGIEKTVRGKNTIQVGFRRLDRILHQTAMSGEIDVEDRI